MDDSIRPRRPNDPPPEQDGNQGNDHVHPIFARILNGMRMCPNAAAFHAANDARAAIAKVTGSAA